MTDPLSPEEIDRYRRHIVLAEIGGAGQQKLKQANVLIVGAGGLGAPVIQYLAAAGIGHIGVLDDDIVSLSNLQRQVIHDTSGLGAPKVASAEAAVARLNPHVAFTGIAERLTADNAARLLAGYDLLVDGSDNFDTRYASA
ncbi:MAG TPA: ThiF family adenylyltransferase, partial [Shinella sp.]|nr:ThiF family adenylyltransferase [Shinella sp.]